ncbi:MAG TPA: ABC transporter permease, partial [Candidatus Sulfotelmatobacter sp.]|nr:ABC transporter permease [Candidatus Sulfotelmatobacter sp.]
MMATERKPPSAVSRLARLVVRPEYSSLFILVVMLAIAAVLQRNFFRGPSLLLTIDAFGPLILLTMGQAVVMVAGLFDLSIGTALSLYTCILTFVMRTNEPASGILAIAVTFVAAVAVGVINGFAAGYLRVSPVVVTFATSFLWLGIALFLRPTPGGQSVGWFNAFYDFRNVAGMSPPVQSISSFLPPVLVLILLGCLLWYFLRRGRTGRYLYAVGGNEESAYRSGIPTARIQITAYVINSIYVFLAALFFVGQSQSGDARFGDPFTLRTIAAAVVGGIALTGGRGSIYFAIVGALIIELVNKIIFFANIPYAYGTLVAGAIVIVAIGGSQLYSN